jgi:hypothetical protein
MEECFSFQPSYSFNHLTNYYPIATNFHEPFCFFNLLLPLLELINLFSFLDFSTLSLPYCNFIKSCNIEVNHELSTTYQFLTLLQLSKYKQILSPFQPCSLLFTLLCQLVNGKRGLQPSLYPIVYHISWSIKLSFNLLLTLLNSTLSHLYLLQPFKMITLLQLDALSRLPVSTFFLPYYNPPG